MEQNQKPRRRIKIAGCLASSVIYYISVLVAICFKSKMKISEDVGVIWIFGTIGFFIASVVLTTIKEEDPAKEFQRKIAVGLNVVAFIVIALSIFVPFVALLGMG